MSVAHLLFKETLATSSWLGGQVLQRWIKISPRGNVFCPHLKRKPWQPPAGWLGKNLYIARTAAIIRKSLLPPLEKETLATYSWVGGQELQHCIKAAPRGKSFVRPPDRKHKGEYLLLPGELPA
jgi:hypothetical protein